MRAQIVLLDGDRILLAEHARGDSSYWVLPGGGVEPGETPEQAAVRETLEETGLHVELDRLLFVDGPRADGPVCIRNPRYTYLARIVGGELRCGEAIGANETNGALSGVAWMPLDSPRYDAATRDTLRLVKDAVFEA